MVVGRLIICDLCSFSVYKEGRSKVSAERAARLKDIALSEENAFSERMRAIDLLCELKDDAFDDLVEIAAKGLTYSERMNALDMLEKIVKRKG